MLGKYDHRAAGKAVALLATCFVVVAGAVTCFFIGVMIGGDPVHLLAIIAACFGGIVLLLFLLRDRKPENMAAARWSWLIGDNKQKVAYRLAPRAPPQEGPVAPNAPPTAESVRALGGGVAWVPSKNGAPSRNPSPRPSAGKKRKRK
ncbi:MAG TPA: hypothetical protein VL475_11330 [Planctomycetaceae bacterium]|nr:hypothetical protein [Planctomycetaceae bacterium]